MTDIHFSGAHVRDISTPDLRLDRAAQASCRNTWAKRREDPEFDLAIRRRAAVASDRARRKRLGQNKITLPRLACLEKPEKD